ncbi:MAG: DUF177 domain-containing protein [Oligoflexia bacterium]|nr:DUF177 domain-containing protein [Oligoflexia bacterium]
MRIHLREITDQETELDFTQADKWVIDAVQSVDEDKTPSPAPASLRPVRAHFSLRKVDDVIVVSGDVDTQLRLLCSRCANAYPLDCSAHFSGLYCRDPAMAGVGHLEGAGKPAGQNKGFARHAHDFEASDAESGGSDLDITYLSQDFIDLGEVLTEQLRLQLPFQPLCQESCKGICANCGADQNTGRCACSKIRPTSPFSALRNFKAGS